MKNAHGLVGKMVTVFTVPTNRDFKAEMEAVGQLEKFPQQVYTYFVGVLEAIDDEGVLLRQATSGLTSYFLKQHIIAICEEEVLDENDPIHKKFIDKMKTAVTQPAKPKKVEPNKTVNTAAIQDMLKGLNAQFGTKPKP